MSTEVCELIPNYIGGENITSESEQRLPICDPSTGETLAHLPLSSREELDHAVQVAAEAQKEWAKTPVKTRVQTLFKLKTLLQDDEEAIAELIHLENGKTIEEAKGELLRGIECVEFATSLPQLIGGKSLEVSYGINCSLKRFPRGVVAGVTPFNFPIMIALWMAPLAIACGNAFILKPSEQTPLTAAILGSLFAEAGLPNGIFSVVNGDREIVEGICDHPGISTIGFVGSTKVAQVVHQRAAANGKSVRALGGAKNHLVLVPDADPELAASNIVDSVTGCAGQRCMAASVLLAVGDVDNILEKIREKMAAIVPGKDMGPVISPKALERITGFLDRAEKLLLDGRKARLEGNPTGNYIGASMIECSDWRDESVQEEIFGPILSVIRCKTLDEALAIENACPYGNAASVYTSSGKVAQEFSERASSGMIGVNIGVPVPREPFPFGGWNASSFGDGDLTGEGAIDFWTQSKKITTKWATQEKSDWMS